jgi:hypothetical protein
MVAAHAGPWNAGITCFIAFHGLLERIRAGNFSTGRTGKALPRFDDRPNASRHASDHAVIA